MALAIDTKRLLEHFIPRYQEEMLDSTVEISRERFQLHRVCTYVTVTQHSSTINVPSFLNNNLWSASQAQIAAWNWQADPEDDVDEVEVFHHLKQLAALAPSRAGVFSENDDTNARTTLLASFQSPTFATRAQGRPPSSFRDRFAFRMTMFEPHGKKDDKNYSIFQMCDLSKVSSLPRVRDFPRIEIFTPFPGLVWASGTELQKFSVLWHWQLDFVDLSTQITHPGSRPGKRRRRTLNPFLQVSPRGAEDTSRVNYVPEAKRFKGVRHRPDRRTWVAEMKPPKRRKVSFGDFKSQTQAARAVDAAFHHYGKTHMVNFADTPQILSTRLPSAGLNEEDMLKFVKEQAKWLASMASTLPSRPTNSPPTILAPGAAASVSSENTEELSRGCNAITAGFRPYAEITSPLSSGGAGEADDGVCSSSMHITDVLNCSEDLSRALTNFVNSPGVEQSCEVQGMFPNFLGMSPPTPRFQIESS